MWRSVVRKASLCRLPRGSSYLLQPQELDPLVSKTPTLHFSPKTLFLQTPRFFSRDSSNAFSHDDSETSQVGSMDSGKSGEVDTFINAHNLFDDETSQIESVDCGKSGDFDGSGDAHNLFDKMPRSVSSDFEEGSVSALDEALRNDGPDVDEEAEQVGNEYEVDLGKLGDVLSLLQSGNVDGSLESSLSNMGVHYHERFLLRVIETPLVPGENLIGLVKWVMKTEKLSVTTPVVASLVRVICREQKNAYALWGLLKELAADNLLTTEILNDLLTLFSKLGKGKAAFEVFNKFEELNCVPNADSFYFTIEALCRRSLFLWAGPLCETMINVRKLPDSEKVGKIISYLCKGKKAKEAHAVYLSAKKENRYPPVSSVDCLISSLCREDANVYLALEMLEDISNEKRKYAIKQFLLVIQGLCRVKDIQKAKSLLFDMIESGPPPGNAVFNIIINTLSKNEEMGEAKKIMEMMESRGLKPDLYAYNVIMSGYAKRGEMEEACKVLAEAKKKHPKLCPVTYHTLIRGYCKLENFDKALELLSEMKQYGVQPSADEYNKLIQSLCLTALDWETAEKLLKEMEKDGLHLNGITKGLIRAVKELEEEKMKTKEVGAEP